jgi:hypothetical protein
MYFLRQATLQGTANEVVQASCSVDFYPLVVARITSLFFITVVRCKPAEIVENFVSSNRYLILNRQFRPSVTELYATT